MFYKNELLNYFLESLIIFSSSN